MNKIDLEFGKIFYFLTALILLGMGLNNWWLASGIMFALIFRKFE